MVFNLLHISFISDIAFSMQFTTFVTLLSEMAVLPYLIVFFPSVSLYGSHTSMFLAAAFANSNLAYKVRD